MNQSCNDEREFCKLLLRSQQPHIGQCPHLLREKSAALCYCLVHLALTYSLGPANLQCVEQIGWSISRH